MDGLDWSSRYREGNTKWDLGRSPLRLLEFIRTQPEKQSVLIPGCGRGYEIEDFQRLGHSVTAIDISSEAIRAAREQIGDIADSIICEDFFAFDLPVGYFDICYERTFLCAIPASLRAMYGRRVSSLLRGNGILAGIFHYGTPEDCDPPYPMTRDDKKEILEEHFSLMYDAPCSSGLPVFSEHDERWQVWRKK